MKLRKWVIASGACLALVTAAGLATALESEPLPEGVLGVAKADGQFRVFYRCEYLGEDETTRSGNVVVAVVNVSGQTVREVSARIPELGASPFGHFPVFVGDIEDGQAKEIVVPFTTFKNEIAEGVENADWHLEYLDSSDTLVTVQVQGDMSI